MVFKLTSERGMIQFLLERSQDDSAHCWTSSDVLVPLGTSRGVAAPFGTLIDI